MKIKITLYILGISCFHLIMFLTGVHKVLIHIYTTHTYLEVDYINTQIFSSFIFLTLIIVFSNKFGVKYYKFWNNIFINLLLSYFSYIISSFIDGNPITSITLNRIDYSFVFAPLIHITWLLGIFMTFFLFFYSKYKLKIKEL